MKKSHMPAKTLPAQTRFEFTDDDIAEALAMFVESKGEQLPPGERCFCYFSRRDGYETKGGIEGTLRIEHV